MWDPEIACIFSRTDQLVLSQFQQPKLMEIVYFQQYSWFCYGVGKWVRPSHIRSSCANSPQPLSNAQLSLLYTVVNAVDNLDHALVGSLSGTGKIFALLCLSLATQKHPSFVQDIEKYTKAITSSPGAKELNRSLLYSKINWVSLAWGPFFTDSNPVIFYIIFWILWIDGGILKHKRKIKMFCSSALLPNNGKYWLKNFSRMLYASSSEEVSGSWTGLPIHALSRMCFRRKIFSSAYTTHFTPLVCAAKSVR